MVGKAGPCSRSGAVRTCTEPKWCQKCSRPGNLPNLFVVQGSAQPHLFGPDPRELKFTDRADLFLPAGQHPGPLMAGGGAGTRPP